MNKDEIKFALECCKDTAIDNCHKCPYHTECRCNDELCKDVFSLINEQENEIEKKGQIIGNLNGLIDYADKEIRKLKAENEKLEEDIDMLIKEQKDDYRFDIIQAKIDVLNELKTRHDYAIKNMGYPWDISQQIDKLIEEIENNGR